MSKRAKVVIAVTLLATLAAVLYVPVELNATWTPGAGAADAFLAERWIGVGDDRIDLDDPPPYVWVWKLGVEAPPITMPYADYTDIPIGQEVPLWRLRWGRLLATLGGIALIGGGLLTFVMRRDRRRSAP